MPVDLPPELHLPGIRQLREVVTNARRRVPSRSTLRSDGVAGLTVGVSSVPDGMAGGLLAGVNPIYGLYANMIGPFVGGLFSSTQLMIINNTSAVSLVAGQSLLGLSSAGRESALFLMVVLTGALSIVLGALRLGQLTRFVSYSVMAGFLAGIAVVLILSQLPTVAGTGSEGANPIMRAFGLLANPGKIDPWSLGTGVVTFALVGLLQRTRLRGFAGLLAISIPSALIGPLDLESVRTVRDFGDIASGFPVPALPDFGDTLAVLTGAASVALVVVVQGTGISQSVPNPDGSRRRISRDFIAQGVANVACGFFRGAPVGGSVSATALNVVSGATSRWSGIFSGLWVAVILLWFTEVVGYVAMPALGALLIFAGVQSIKPKDLLSVWHAGPTSRIAGAVTFSATLILPIQIAVAVGVVLSAALYIARSSTDVAVIELVKRSDGRIEEHEPPTELPSNKVTVLDIYGHVFYAGTRKIEAMLPRIEKDARHPVVVLRLRGRTALGATMVGALTKYVGKLRAADGRLYLTGLSEPVRRHLMTEVKVHLHGPLRAYEVTPILGESTEKAAADAEAWLLGLEQDD